MSSDIAKEKDVEDSPVSTDSEEDTVPYGYGIYNTDWGILVPKLGTRDSHVFGLEQAVEHFNSIKNGGDKSHLRIVKVTPATKVDYEGDCETGTKCCRASINHKEESEQPFQD